jgi:transposase-like protein
MNPSTQFCPNPACTARGKIKASNIHVHSQKQQRYRCTVCGKTFSATHGSALYGLKHERAVFVKVTTLLAYGCPVQAAARAFDLDERTVRDWETRVGAQCQAVHQHLLRDTKLD